MSKQNQKNHVYIRTDSSSLIGSGHLFRCLALALALRSRGADVEFICRDLPNNIIDVVKQHSFKVHRLAGYSEAQEFNWHEDAELTLGVLGASSNTSLIVDHYQIDHRWEALLRIRVSRLLVIDDLANRMHHCDLLLDVGYFSNPLLRYEKRISRSCTYLLGPHYALLRDSFSKENNKRDYLSIKNILLFFGAADPSGSAIDVLEVFRDLQLKQSAIHLVLGLSDSNKGVIRKIASEIAGVKVYEFVKDMYPLLKLADLYVGSGGTITWERCCLALPSIVIAVAKNQEASCAALSDMGVIQYLGPAGTFSRNQIRISIETMCGDLELRKSMGERSARLVDGRGANRVARALLAGAISLERVQKEDCRLLYRWRNAPETRRYSNDSREINLDDHNQWFEASLRNPNRSLLVAISGTEKVGVFRVDRSGSSALVSIYLNPSKKGMGYGPEILIAGRDWVKKNMPSISRLEAKILPDNIASISAFQSAGFIKINSLYTLTL